MKIKKAPVKKLAVPPLPIRNLIKTLKESPETELAAHIEATPEWTWPRGDLFHWVGVLNRFDEILDTLCKTHDMKKPQPKEFSLADRRLTLAILSFSRLLLESCTNRNLYSSYEQLNDLLNTRDMDILESCLRLLLRPAQRHSAQRSARSIFTVSQDRLLALAHSWGSKEYGLDLQQLADDNAEIPERLRSVSFQFFRTVAPAKTPTTDSPTTSSAAPSGSSTTTAALTAPTSASTPAPPISASGKPRRHSNSGASSSHASSVATAGTTTSALLSASEGLVVIQVSDPQQLGATDYEILNHLVQEYKVPEEHHFQLLSRIRIATGIRDTKRRQQLLLIRILAIAVMSHVLSEAIIVEKFFAFEPETIQSLTDLIHPDHKVPFPVQTVALFALDGLAHLRNRQSDVLTAINASASHGVLLYALRKVITGLDSENAPYPQDFLDAMFALISYIISSQTGGNMVISAGLVPVLLQLLSNKYSSQLKNVTKSVTILDSLVYGFSTAFSSFCTSGGLNSLVARMKEEVDYSLKLVKDAEASQMTDISSMDTGAPKEDETSPIPFERTALSKAMFKFIIHMMQSPGTHEGLRNLIETTLPATLRDIMEHPSALGNSIYAHAINTMTSFIHNEPTSLSILQEAKIPQTLLASLSKDIPASNDVVMNLPGAFGAICLNATGLEMFTKEFDIKKFFDVFTSVPHVRVFQDSDIASTLGVSMDELARHQPTLKPKVMAELGETLKTVLKMCESDAVTEDDISLCTLQKSRAKDAPPFGEVVDDDANRDDRKDSLVAQLIESSARFCESYFQNAASAHEFLQAGGIDTLLRFYSLPTLPYDLANSSAFFTLSHLLKLLSEANPAAAISAVVKEVNRILQQVQPLLDSTNAGSDLVQYIDLKGSGDEDVSRGNNLLRSLISLHAFSGLLSDMYCAPTFSHGRNSAAVLAAFVSAQGDQALAGLGQLHRVCLWESIAMKRILGKDWNDPNSKAKRAHVYAPMPGTVDENVEEPAGEDKEMAAAIPSVDMYSPTVINTKFLRFVLTQIPQYITPMYQGITKMLFSRREMEPAQRANAFKIADSLSGVLQSHITWKRLNSSDSLSDKYTYLSTMFNLLPYLLLDDRNPTTLQTIMAASFFRTGGLEALFTWLDSAWTEASAIKSASTTLDGEQKVLLAKVHGCVETLLSVLQTLTSSKILLESSHTAPLTSKDDKSRKEDFFNPHEFLVDVRLLVVPRIQQLWMDKHLEHCPALLVRHIIQIIINLLKAAGELKPPVVAPPPPSSGTGAGTGAGSSASNVFGVRPIVPDANSVAMLLDMGFPRSAAELALTRSGNQLERATEYLLTHQEVVAAAIYEQEREEAAARAAAIAAANDPPVPPTAVGSADTTTTTASDAGASNATEQASSEVVATVDTSVEQVGSEDDEDDEDEEDEEEMLRQALEMSRALDVAMADEETTSISQTQESTTEAGQDAVSATTAQATADETSQEEAIDVEDDQPTEEEKREQEYKLALERHQEHKDHLSKAREELQLLLVSRSLELIESIDDIVFYVRDLFVLLCKDKDSIVLEELVKDLEKASTSLKDASRGHAFGARLRLLALLFGDVTIQSKMSNHTTTLVPLLLSILEEHVKAQALQNENPWLSPLLLMVESFISLSDEPKVVPDEAAPDGKGKAADREMKEDIVSPVDLESLLQHSITLLKQEDLTKDIALSVFRILVRLTRHHSLAMSFLRAQGLDLIFSTLKPERIGVQGQQSFIVMILRHIIEDAVILQEVMEKEIVRWFTQPSRARTGDLQSYLRHNNFLGLRDLDAFIAGTLAVSKVSKYDSSYRALQLTLTKLAVPPKPEDSKDQGESAKQENTDKDKDKEQEKDAESNVGESSSTSVPPPADPLPSAASVTTPEASANAIAEASKKYSSEISEAVIHFLVSELLGSRDSVAIPTSPTSTSGDGFKHGDSLFSAMTVSHKDTTPATAIPHDTNFIHRCFVLQCLNELLISYPSCKVDLMNYSRRKGGKDSSHTATKPRSSWLNFLLNDLIPYRGTVAQSSETELRKHSIESNFASAVLVAMCSNGDEEEEKKPFSELVQVRRFVIDGLIRSFKDAIASSLPVEFKYGKFLSLSELSYKILGSSPPAGAMTKPSEDMSINIVKVMLEKNFILMLTNVLADIDLNYPHAKILVNAVLKPLEHLTKLSLKMSRATDPRASRAKRQSTPLSVTGSGAGSGDDAPDLYRNSSLGMFDGATMESAEDDDSEDEGDEDDIFEGEEYDEETASDASDLSEDELSDDDDDEDELEEMVDRNPFHHHSHEMSDDEEDHDDEDMEGDDDDDGLDEEMEAELQEALDNEDDEDEMMEWDADSRPIILQDDEIGEVIDDEDDDPQVADPEYYDEQDRAHRHHTHTHNPHLNHGEPDGMDGGEDEEDDEDEDDLDDLDEDEEEDEEDDEEDDDIVLLDDVEGFDPVRAPGRGAPWDMTSTFVINDQSGLLNGAQVVDLRGRRPRASGRRLEDRGFVAYDSTADQGRFSYIEDDEFPLLGAPARNPFLQVSDDVITHPLLALPRPTSANVTTDLHRRSASRGGLGGGISDWHAFEELLNGNPSQILGTLMNGGAIRASHGAFRVEVNSGHGHAIVTPIDRAGSRSAAPADAASVAAGGSFDAASANKPDMFSIVQNFVPFSTSQRWSQECRMMYGATAQDKATRLMNHITNALIPATKEEYRIKQERDAKELEIRRNAEVEKKRIAEEKKKAEEEAERIRAEEAERVRVAEEAAAAELEAARLAELAAARATRGETEEEAVAESAMEVEEGAGATIEPAEEAEPPAPARRTVMIDGVMVDITDSDIDPEFLEALPEDMRREVYNDYLQSRRPPAPTAAQQPATSTSTASQSINSDFLEALPQNMRAELDEILRGQGAVPDDPASGLPMMTAFTDTLSRLVPQLRQIYQDGGNNSAALAEASAILDRMPRNYPGLREVRDMIASTGSGSSVKKAIVPRDAIQLVDKSSLATLVRLMFLPQPPSKNILNKLLANLCENSKTRTELLSLLLSILQDGGADLAAVDKSFAQMSLRGKPIVKAHHHKGKGTGTVPAPTPSAMDNVPNLVARRCFDALYYIVSLNSQAAQFFITEHENVTLKRSPSKKGKGKDKDKTISSKFPIVLLLGLLERPTFVENSALMEQLMTLLSILCRPLAALVKDDEEKDKKTGDKDKKETEPTPVEPSALSTSVEAVAASSAGTHPTTTAGEGSTATLSAAPAETTAPTEIDTKADVKVDTKAAETEPPALIPPVIPDHCIQLVIRVLTAGDCSSRTFQYTLSVIQNLSVLEGARDVITVELVRAARELGVGILTDLGALSETLTNAMTGVDVQGVVLEQFTLASSKQAKLLRVLKTIDYMYSRKQGLTPAPASTQVNIELAPTLDPEEADAVMPRSMRDVGSGATNLNKDEEKATQIYDSLTFQPLWTKVGEALELIHERSDMVHVATVLLPLIESFMVVCKYVGLRPSTLEMEEEVCKSATNSTEELFLQFTEKHSKILNIMVRNNPALMSGSFSLLVHNPKMLEFDNKRNYFTQQVHKRAANQGHYGTLQMNVRREMVFIDSFTQLQSRSGEDIKYSKLNVHFHGEEGVDAGGVTREWFQVLARQMFNPDYAMFKTSAADKLTYQPNRASWVNPDHLLFFKFIGRVIGKAIYDGRLLDAYFTRSFYKHILGRPVDYRDVEAVDPEYYKSLVWMLDNDITDIVEETFSVETDDFGTMKTVDLKPNGRNIPVTEENKHEYVKYITEQKLTLAIKDQIHSFLQGFHEIIPAHLISIFNEQELELLISGLPDIDVDEWKNNTEYQNYSPASPQIQYFWRAVRSFDQTERAKLLQFVTGTSKVPLGGFSQLQGISGVQKFQIHKDFSSTKRLPSAHTCFNQLDLPEYETYDELRQQLLTAISECSTGFAFA
ncbi:hypothetical protein BGZ96_005696 [Linnemannia gamsii]|uniref:HECT-type E3 ubiquitin transferase n=1 Tax=Linnemannia gamsii TaxID=64522 RepID=A0ABQ7KEH1_9FUNG|nr:hypothetical protein BGZ96_005696 [Linnemannia gamsii]